MALRLFAAAGTAFLVLILGVAFTGGGLGRTTVSEPLNSVLVFATWIALIAVLPLLAAACIAAAVSIARSTSRPAVRRNTGRRRANTRTMVETGSAPGADRPRQTGVLVVLLILSVGGVFLFVRTSQQPSLDDMPLGIGLLALGVIALVIVLLGRLIRIARRLTARLRTY